MKIKYKFKNENNLINLNKDDINDLSWIEGDLIFYDNKNKQYKVIFPDAMLSWLVFLPIDYSQLKKYSDDIWGTNYSINYDYTKELFTLLLNDKIILQEKIKPNELLNIFHSLIIEICDELININPNIIHSPLIKELRQKINF